MMSLTRRELLTIFLGAPFAMNACRTGESRPFPEGQIVGQSATLGHILREPPPLFFRRKNWERKKVGLIGGGIAGL